MAAVKRGWPGTLLDRLFGWANGLPSESGSYTIERLHIPVGGNVKLEADLYRPIRTKPIGTVLVRSPYGIDITLALGHARIFAARGYQVLLSTCRGTGKSGSDGAVQSGNNEVADGHALVSWMREQAWYTGSFATLGPSYLGYVQWALLTNPPADMKASVINTGPHDFSHFIWGTGAFCSNAIAWADLLERMKHGGFVPLPLWMLSQPGRLRPVFDSVPLLRGVDKYFGAKTPPFLLEAITHPSRSDPLWKGSQLDDALEKANIPILLTSGWYDLNLENVMLQYSKLTERGCNVALTVGPWTHLGAGGRNTMKETLGWLDEHLAEVDKAGRASPVRIFVTGAEEWRDLPSWPPSTASYELFLAPDRKLLAVPPPASASHSSFTFNPTDPTPAIGVPLLFANNKDNDSTSLATRSDVLTFTTEPLDRDLEVCGRPSVELHHSSNHPHVDLLVLLSEVSSNGKSHTISEKYIRLAVDREQDLLHLSLHDCAHKFSKGSRIRLLLAGGSHPRYIRNLGTGADLETETTPCSALHTIQHHASAISKLVLPTSAPSS